MDDRKTEEDRALRLSRRRLLGGALAAGPALAALHEVVPHQGLHDALGGDQHPNAVAAADRAHAATASPPTPTASGTAGPTFRDGATVDHRANGFNPTEILRDFDYGKTRRHGDGPHGSRVGARRRRQGDRGRARRQVPGLDLQRPDPGADAALHARATCCASGSSTGRRTRTRSTSTACTRRRWTGSPASGAGIIAPGKSTVYEFNAEPFGLHLYHCHVAPLAEHIARGMYGTFIVDPKQGRADADEMVMVQHGYNTTFDAEGNQLYAVNGIPFHYMAEPIKVKRGELVRIYLVNALEYDPINSFHIHGNFFDYYPTGTTARARRSSPTR